MSAWTGQSSISAPKFPLRIGILQHGLFECEMYALQSLGYGGYPIVEVLRTAPAPDEAILRGGQSIPVHGADGGLAFGPTPNWQDRQTVFDATFYRPVNASFTGSFPSPQVSGFSY